MAQVAKIGKAFLIGSGIAYPLQRGILKVGPKRIELPKIAKSTKVRAKKRLKKS